MTKEISLIQEYLKDHKLDGYIVFTNDDHGSEYVVDYYKARAFLSGFTGSAGTMLITKEDAYVWTDGRYFLQASEQLKTTGTKLMKMGVENVESLEQFVSHLAQNVRIAFDFRLATVAFVKGLLATYKNIEIVDEPNLIDMVWLNRPAMVASQAYCLKDEDAGESVTSKLERTLSATKKYGCDYALLSSLDDIAWLFNLRGNDITYNPVCYSYALISAANKVIYLNKACLTDEVREHFTRNGIVMKDYLDVYQDIKGIKESVLLDEGKTNYALYSLVLNKKAAPIFPTTAFKTIKNQVEIENMKKAHRSDAVAVIKFMKWIKENAGKMDLDELTVQAKLQSFREENEDLLDLSFGTICGYKENGAIIHYAASEATNKKITNESLLLVDSGGQYRYGTTDITRTFVLGPLTDQEKEDFTLVLKSHIALADAVFPRGVNGYGLDVVARMPLFKKYKNYNHGTGHGVGYLLNVHEGPQSFNMRTVNKFSTYPLLPGMITSDEPGIYLEGQYGVRHESLLLTVEKESNSFGSFLGFEAITYVPFDLDGIDVGMLTDDEKNWLNAYNKMCYQTIAPMVDEKLREYLKEITRSI